MEKLKKWTAFGLSFVLAAGILGGCSKDNQGGGNNATGGKGYVPKILNVEFVPSQNAGTLEAKAKPMEKLLSDRLHIPVKVSVSTDYNTIIEAMASKKVDIGFLPPTAYVMAHDKGAANVLLQALRYGVNDQTGQPTKTLVDFYKSEFLVKKNSNITGVKELKGKKIAFQDVTSSAGYVWPAATLMDAGIDPTKDVQGVTVKGHDQAVISLLNGDVDCAVVFQDARNLVKKDYPTVFNDTKIIKFTAKIPNDTISVRSDMDPKWAKKIQDAFVAIGKDPQGLKIIESIYSHEGYTPSNDKVFNIVRQYSKKVKTD